MNTFDRARTSPSVGGSETIDQAWRDALRSDILEHVKVLGLPALNDSDGTSTESLSKEMIRASHRPQRDEWVIKEMAALDKRWDRLFRFFANGTDVHPEDIRPELVPAEADRDSGYLFRMATLLWSVPVSRGYGRRMRYLVMDRSNDKLIGVFALGDPVFNLGARDRWIGWDVEARRQRLVHVMDAYVVGAVPPYSSLLGGKLVTSLIGSAEVSRDFSARYSQTRGIISGENKAARLALVTITSALGRSSLYNRLKLRKQNGSHNNGPVLVELVRIGETRGYGHFHLSNSIFERIRLMLASEDHRYASGHQFGQGPNWRLRVIRVGLQKLGLDEELIRHGITREVYAMPLATNYRDFLCGFVEEPSLNRPTVGEISSSALIRWVLPRAASRPEYAHFRRQHLLQLMQPKNDTPSLLEEQQLPLPLTSPDALFLQK